MTMRKRLLIKELASIVDVSATWLDRRIVLCLSSRFYWEKYGLYVYYKEENQ